MCIFLQLNYYTLSINDVKCPSVGYLCPCIFIFQGVYWTVPLAEFFTGVGFPVSEHCALREACRDIHTVAALASVPDSCRTPSPFRQSVGAVAAAWPECESGVTSLLCSGTAVCVSWNMGELLQVCILYLLAITNLSHLIFHCKNLPEFII